MNEIFGVRKIFKWMNTARHGCTKSIQKELKYRLCVCITHCVNMMCLSYKLYQPEKTYFVRLRMNFSKTVWQIIFRHTKTKKYISKQLCVCVYRCIRLEHASQYAYRKHILNEAHFTHLLKIFTESLWLRLYI